jgi:RHS repeat-associated protein
MDSASDETSSNQREWAVNSPFRLHGQYYDAETGLGCTRHRYFDAQTARWCSPDPIGIAGGMNLFGFNRAATVAADPLGLTDGGPHGGADPPPPLPANPDDLVTNHGYTETSHPGAAAAGHRSFEHPQTGDSVRFDAGGPGATGHEANDHYHRYNPNSTSRHDQYLDSSGNPVGRGSDASHLYPGD